MTQAEGSLRTVTMDRGRKHGDRAALSLDGFAAAYSQVASANKSKFSKLKLVLARFHQQGVDCILLKGADLIPRLYGALGVRPMADVDLLVHEQDLPAIDRILRELGYRSQIDGNPAYSDHDNTLALDIITRVWYLDDPDLIWQRAVQRDLEGVPVKAMGTNDLLVFLAAYAVVHRGCLSGSFAQDVTLLVQKEAVDWAFVVDEACRRHVKIPLHHGLSYVVTRHGRTPIPDRVLRSLAPSSLTERSHAFLFRHLVTDTQVSGLGHLLLFITQPGWKRWRWLRESLFPPAAFLNYRYGKDWRARPFWTRLWRPFYVLSQALRLSVRVTVVLLRRRWKP